MQRRTKVSLIVAAAVFLALFAARFASELARERESAYPQARAAYAEGEVLQDRSVSQTKRNYASAKIAIAAPSAAAQVLDQKYEEVAALSATSSDFDADSRRLKEAAAAAKAVVQREDAYGLPGSRELSLSLGVVPSAFDQAVDALRAIGKLESITINKTDRTADFKALEAKRLSLEKTRDGLAALRRAGAGLSELVALETKILEIEGQIQELGVSLGDFSEGNSFCTVNASLRERAAGPLPARILGIALDALGWAAAVTVALALACLAAAGTAYLVAKVATRIREREAKGS